MFDIQLEDKQLKLFEGQRTLAKDEVKDRIWCKYHDKFGYTTYSYVHFKDMIEKAIK